MHIGYEVLEGGVRRPAVLVRTPELTIERGDRVGLIGPNGTGKTTLLRTLTGEIPPLKGRFQLGTAVKIGYYAQAHEQLRHGTTPLALVLEAEAMGEEAARTFLGKFLFSGDDVFKPVEALSGGERSRLALALLLLQRANFLVLDEPTNHLDVLARENLEEMLSGFDGTILFVSHDRFFIDRIATKIWAIEDGVLKTYLGNYTDYQRQLGHRPELASKDGRAGADAARQSAAAPTPQPQARPSNGQLQKSLAQIEREIGRLEGKLNELSDALTVASIDADVEAVSRLSEEYERVQADLDAAYERWEAVSTEFEAATAGSR